MRVGLVNDRPADDPGGLDVLLNQLAARSECGLTPVVVRAGWPDFAQYRPHPPAARLGAWLKEAQALTVTLIAGLDAARLDVPLLPGTTATTSLDEARAFLVAEPTGGAARYTAHGVAVGVEGRGGDGAGGGERQRSSAHRAGTKGRADL